MLRMRDATCRSVVHGDGVSFSHGQDGMTCECGHSVNMRIDLTQCLTYSVVKRIRHRHSSLCVCVANTNSYTRC